MPSLHTLTHYAAFIIATSCPACRRNGPLLVVLELIERFGPETPLDAVCDRLRCRSCGARGEIRIIIDVRWKSEPEAMIQRYGRDDRWRPWPVVRIEAK